MAPLITRTCRGLYAARSLIAPQLRITIGHFRTIRPHNVIKQIVCGKTTHSPLRSRCAVAVGLPAASVRGASPYPCRANFGGDSALHFCVSSLSIRQAQTTRRSTPTARLLCGELQRARERVTGTTSSACSPWVRGAQRLPGRVLTPAQRAPRAGCATATTHVTCTAPSSTARNAAS
jgi:hypothetical protein